MLRSIALLTCVLAFGCATSEVIKTSASQWKLCWELCGKKNKLTAVSGTMCLCEGGYKIESAPEKAEEPKEPFSLFEFLGLKAEGK